MAQSPVSAPPADPGRALAERFLQDLCDAWMARGSAAIEQVIIERPQDVVRIVASLAAGRPSEPAEEGLGALSEAELEAVVAAARGALGG
jgi:hypothetical protein